MTRGGLCQWYVPKKIDRMMHAHFTLCGGCRCEHASHIELVLNKIRIRSLSTDCEIDSLLLRSRRIYLSDWFNYRIILSRHLCTKHNPNPTFILILLLFSKTRRINHHSPAHPPHLLMRFRIYTNQNSRLTATCPLFSFPPNVYPPMPFLCSSWFPKMHRIQREKQSGLYLVFK